MRFLMAEAIRLKAEGGDSPSDRQIPDAFRYSQHRAVCNIYDFGQQMPFKWKTSAHPAREAVCSCNLFLSMKLKT